jgi:hypothetical protein
MDFVRRLDLGEPGSVAELFTEEGTWEWPDGPDGGRLVKGREALREYVGSRPADRVDGYEGGMVPSGPPVQVGDYEDTFRRVHDRWLLEARVLHLPFGGPTPRTARH